MKFTMKKDVPDGTMLLIGVQYRSPGAIDPDKVFDYVLLKAGGYWYGSGTGRVPQAAGWAAVERWLEQNDRHVVYVDQLQPVQRLYQADTAPEYGRQVAEEMIRSGELRRDYSDLG